jgi:hypothetical protein
MEWSHSSLGTAILTAVFNSLPTSGVDLGKQLSQGYVPLCHIVCVCLFHTRFSGFMAGAPLSGSASSST